MKGYDICIYNYCNIKSSFNFSGCKKSLYCAQHKLKGMVNLNNKQDINDFIHFINNITTHEYSILNNILNKHNNLSEIKYINESEILSIIYNDSSELFKLD